MKNTFLAISNHIIANVPQIKIVDLYLGQLASGNFPNEYPIVYLSIAYPSVDIVDNDTQEVAMSVSAQLVFDASVAETSTVIAEPWRSKSLEVLNVVDDLTNCLHGFTTDTFAPLTLQSVTSESGSGLHVYTITLSSSLEVTY